MERALYRFKITLRQQILLLTPAIASWLGVILLIKYYLHASLYSPGAIFAFIFLSIIDTIPAIILQVQYWRINHDILLIIDTAAKELSYETSSQIFKHSFNDIVSLQYYRSYGKGSGWNSFGMYRYYKIIFTDKTEINITCLMVNDIENTIENLLRIKAEKHFKLLCLV